MSWLKTLWSLLFRLFPCPAPRGLRKLGTPDATSPVLVTGNFHLTLRRLERALTGRDAWVVVANSKGINNWCAAGAGELTTREVVAAIKTSRVMEKVEHGTVILPPLCGPAVRAIDVADATGSRVVWGPVTVVDLPRFLDDGMSKTSQMKRTSWGWRDRLDAGLGTMFPFYALGLVGFVIFGWSLLPHFAVVGLVALVFFLVAAPWIPGRSGLQKALLLQIPLVGLLLFTETVTVIGRLPQADIRASTIIAMVALFAYGVDLGGMSATLKSEFDPFMARLGVRKAFGIEFAGTLRTDLLLGRRALHCDEARCTRCGRCVEICPLGIWQLEESRARPLDPESCTGCTACLLQCPVDAITSSEAGES